MAGEPNKKGGEREVVEGLVRQVSDLAAQVEQLTAWKGQREAQQLSYPLDFTSQSIIQSFVKVGGASFLQLGGVKGFGVYWGEGSPNGVVPAGKGSLFLNSTGSSTSTRAYINTDGATAWTSVTTAS